MTDTTATETLDQDSHEFYSHTLQTLTASDVPFLLAGAYAFQRYTGIARHTKDLDVFILARDIDRALAALAEAGYRTELTFPHWLGKAHSHDNFVDLIFRSGNGISTVDDSWFVHAMDDHVLGIPVKVCPAEELLWTKLFIMERERYDGADVAHVIRARGPELDWSRLLKNVGEHWRVLLSHLILFGFIYPSERERVPGWVIQQLLQRLQTDLASPPSTDRVCQGTFLSRAQYLIDLERDGFRDARLEPTGNMTVKQTEHWTAAIEDEHPPKADA